MSPSTSPGRSLRRAKSFAWKMGASTKLAAGLLQYMTKKDYLPFFEKYYWGIEMPKD